MSHRTGWGRGAVVVALSLLILGLATCGAGGPAVSHLGQRAFLSDDLDGTLHIENAATDQESGFTIITGPQPGKIVLSPDKTISLVFNAAALTLSVVSNSTEASLGSVVLPNVSTSYAALSGNITGFAAVPNCPPASCGGFTDVVEVVDLATTFNITNTVNTALDPNSGLDVPLNTAATLALSPTDSKLLLFGGPADHQNAFTVIDTGQAMTTPSTAGTLMSGAAFDRPIWAVFSSDGTKAFVLSCGAECGGAAAGITMLDLTTTPPTVGTHVALPAASFALLSGNTMYVAGTPPSQPAGFCPATLTPCGTLSVLDITNLAAGASSSVPISDGFHSVMALASNNKLFIGAGPNCTHGCLTIFDISSKQAGVDGITGNVAGIAPINNRTVVYVVEDVAAQSFHCQSQSPCRGKLRIYDATASATTPTLQPIQIDVVGKANDVKYVDK